MIWHYILCLSLYSFAPTRIWCVLPCWSACLFCLLLHLHHPEQFLELILNSYGVKHMNKSHEGMDFGLSHGHDEGQMKWWMCMHFVNSRGWHKSSYCTAGKHGVVPSLVSDLQLSRRHPRTESQFSWNPWSFPGFDSIFSGKTWVVRSECYQFKPCLCEF